MDYLYLRILSFFKKFISSPYFLNIYVDAKIYMLIDRLTSIKAILLLNRNCILQTIVNVR